MRIIFYLYLYLVNNVVNKIPIHFFRKSIYKVSGIKIGLGTSIHMNTYVNRFAINIGENSVINRGCYLDGRGGLTIGNNVSISPNVQLLTASHDPDSPGFSYITKSIIVEDFVWIGTGALILPGVVLKKGTVVAAGSVVTKSTEPMSIIGGNPARFIRERKSSLRYHCKWRPPFF
jgi:acetyltransferase-like isoleucine patch superfamily enzyme